MIPTTARTVCPQLREELHAKRGELYTKRVELSRDKGKSLGEREQIPRKEQPTTAVNFLKRRNRAFEAPLGQFLANLAPVKTTLALPAYNINRSFKQRNILNGSSRCCADEADLRQLC